MENPIKALKEKKKKKKQIKTFNSWTKTFIGKEFFDKQGNVNPVAAKQLYSVFGEKLFDFLEEYDLGNRFVELIREFTQKE